jgi:uncharacterized damage-inducible protein DinB
MLIRDALLPEFDMEAATTRKVLERIPDDKLGWKPHTKSWTMEELAFHIAGLPEWGTITIGQDSIDVGGERPKHKAAETCQELLAKFDANVAAFRAALAEVSNETLMSPWSLKHDGNVLFTMPKVTVLRSWVFNHAIHHRGVLSVYLRLNDIPVPQIYGPTADETGMM